MTDSKIVAVNSTDKSFTSNRYLFAFGAYGDTKLLCWGNHLGDAFDAAIDWIADNEPGLLCDEAVKESFHREMAEGKEEYEAWETATQDTTCGGNYSNYVNSWEWVIVAENPTRAQLLDIQGRSAFKRAALSMISGAVRKSSGNRTLPFVFDCEGIAPRARRIPNAKHEDRFERHSEALG